MKISEGSVYIGIILIITNTREHYLLIKSGQESTLIKNIRFSDLLRKYISVLSVYAYINKIIENTKFINL